MSLEASITQFMKIFLVSLWLASVVNAMAVEPIWLSPTNVNYDSPSDYTEQFPERGVWTNIPVGAGGRSEVPTMVMDSKKTLWIMFGSTQSYPDRIWAMTVWNYDPKTDLYRWVAGPGNATAYLRNPGELRVPSKDNFPGGVTYNRGTIDHNDNIWFMSYRECCELWMFNTTSFMFTRMQGNSSENSFANAVFGTQGVPSDDVQPGAMADACLVTDSKNNLWLLSGISDHRLTNAVWHFNTTSLQWTFINGNSTLIKLGEDYTGYGDNPLYGGRSLPGCDIDESDRVWLFGGSGSFMDKPEFDDVFSDVWSFDTRTNQWQLEYGSDANLANAATIVSNDFDPGNMPSAKESATVVNRKDGTLIVVCGAGYTNSSDESWAAHNDVWLFNKTSKQWKLVYGDPFVGDFPGTFTHYRTPGSAMPGRYNHAAANGLNVDGDVFIYGGQDVPVKDIWWIPCTSCSTDSQSPSQATPSETVSSGLKLFASHFIFIFCLLVIV